MTFQFEQGKFQYGVGLNLKVDIIKNTFGYFRLSLTTAAGKKRSNRVLFSGA